MGNLIPVQYRSHIYPFGIQAQLQEVVCNFDANPLSTRTRFSMHTEYSFEKRHFKCHAVQGLHAITSANQRGIPQLWRSAGWADEFVTFTTRLADGRIPDVVEIHPPFNDYSSLEQFLETYAVFEQGILSRFPNVTLLVENRSGTHYPGGSFVLSTAEQLSTFSDLLDRSSLRLKITLDIPQLFTAHKASQKDIAQLLDDMRKIRHNISGIHLWGKRKNAKGTRTAHQGDLNSYFYNSQQTKALFLQQLVRFADDGSPRYFVPEVNSGRADFLSIIQDLLSAGFCFV